MKSEEMIRSVMCMLAADGSVNKLEIQFLQRLCQQFGVSKDVVEAAFEEIKRGEAHIALPNTSTEKKQLFAVLVQAAVADGKVGPQERTMLDAVAEKMGIDASVVERSLAQGLKYRTSKQAAPEKTSPPSGAQVHTKRKKTSSTPLTDASPEQHMSGSHTFNTMICPKCGVEQQEAPRCIQCGIFIKNYLKQQRKAGEQYQTRSQAAPLSKRIPISLYTPSGTFTIYALPIGVLFGLVTAAGVGWLYQLIIGWNPFIYLNVLLTIIYAALIGRAVGLGLQFGKCRNVMIGVVLAFIMAGIGDLLTFRYAYSGMAAIQAQVEDGWVISRFGLPIGIPLQGPAVYLVWAIEFILICGIAMATASIAPSEPFCERCQQWTKKRHLGKIPGVNERYLLKALQEGNLEPFLQPPPQASWKTVCYDLYSCPRCRQGRYLSVTVEWEEDGKKAEEIVLEYALVTHEQIAELRNTLRQSKARDSQEFSG